MRNPALIATIAFLAGCATPTVENLKGCDGRNIRSANPYGVTLPGVPTNDISPPAPVEVFPKAESSASEDSQIEVPAIEPQASLSTRYRSC